MKRSCKDCIAGRVKIKPDDFSTFSTFKSSARVISNPFKFLNDFVTGSSGFSKTSSNLFLFFKGSLAKISLAFFVFGSLKDNFSRKIRAFCEYLPERAMQSAFWRTFLGKESKEFVGLGPKTTPPPRHWGTRILPTLALPVPFWRWGFRPPPETSALVLVDAVFVLWLER